MSGWLGMLGPTAGSIFRNFLSGEPNPHKVVEVKQDNYSFRPIKCREDGIVLYGAIDDNCAYEIVMNLPTTESMNKAFSLFRSHNLDSAEVKFVHLKETIAVIAEVQREMCNQKSLQVMCDTIAQNPSWNVAHLAAFLDLFKAFNSEKISAFINAADPNTGLSPLLVAIQNQNYSTIQTLIEKNASVEHVDNEENSVFHHAAKTSKDIISLLTSNHRIKSLNYRNRKGYTPLHVACLADNPECVKALLLAGADCNISSDTGDWSPHSSTSPGQAGCVGDIVQQNSDQIYEKYMKYGGTPLHWSSSREVINSLLDMNCHINAQNFQGRTALHNLVLRGKLDCIMTLLCRGAEINIGDVDGNTPLHLAVMENPHPENNPISILQALIVFGADIHYRNFHGETARHIVSKRDSAESLKMLYVLHSVGSERCNEDTVECSEGCSYSGTLNGVAPTPPLVGHTRNALNSILFDYAMDVAATQSEKRKPCRALCLDGGGIRGLVLIIMLRELEIALGQPILSCFDWVAGTSTGGILALGLAVGKSLHECLCLYFRMKDITFVGKRPYASEPLEQLLQDCFGPTTLMAEISHPKLLVTGLLADRKPVDLHIFRNYSPPCEILGEEEHSNSNFKPLPDFSSQLVWRAARASGAAPTFFSMFGRFLDGGLIANNPTLDCLTEIHEYNLAMKAKDPSYKVSPVTLVVSLGTGDIPVTEQKQMDLCRPNTLLGATKLVFGIAQLGTLIIDQATQSAGRVVDRARSWCSMIGARYYRFSPQLSEEIDIDERSNEKLVNMVWECQAYMYSQRHIVNELAAVLKGT